MKCKSCDVELSPKFTAAIRQNRCPACGNMMMSKSTYKKIAVVKKQISELGFDEDHQIGIAAALATKFTLVPKDLGLEEDDDGEEIEVELDESDLRELQGTSASNSVPIGKNKIPSKTVPVGIQRVDDDESEVDVNYSEEEREEIMNTFFKNPVPLGSVDSSVKVNISEHLDPELANAIQGIDSIGGDAPDGGTLHGSNTDSVTRQAELLARAEASRGSSNAPNFRRVTY